MNADQLRLYFIMGSTDTGEKDPLNVLEGALQSGITLFQWRDKNSSNPRANLPLAQACQALCREYNVPFVIDDDVDLALKLKADGVHIGKDDRPLAEAKKILAPGQFVGYSVHSLADLNFARHHHTDYVGIGPVFPTSSKKDALPPLGLDFLRKARRAAPDLPMVAIGGIERRNFTRVLATEVDGIAVISAICRDPQFARDFWRAFGERPLKLA